MLISLYSSFVFISCYW